MKIDLTKYTIDELVKLRDQINGLIYNHSDGYLYICSVRQFGSVWEERPSSFQSLKELCDEYRGDNGIVDVYTNNPNLRFPEMEFYNYGDVMYIKSEYDYREWVKYNKSQRFIESVTEQLDKWENRMDVSFNYRPSFEPIWTREELGEHVLDFESTSWDFVVPEPMKTVEEY
jgi:hypothetical protein